MDWNLSCGFAGICCWSEYSLKMCAQPFSLSTKLHTFKHMQCWNSCKWFVYAQNFECKTSSNDLAGVFFAFVQFFSKDMFIYTLYITSFFFPTPPQKKLRPQNEMNGGPFFSTSFMEMLLGVKGFDSWCGCLGRCSGNPDVILVFYGAILHRRWWYFSSLFPCIYIYIYGCFQK